MASWKAHLHCQDPPPLGGAASTGTDFRFLTMKNDVVSQAFVLKKTKPSSKNEHLCVYLRWHRLLITDFEDSFSFNRVMSKYLVNMRWGFCNYEIFPRNYKIFSCFQEISRLTHNYGIFSECCQFTN